jgi:glycosyltransferase involved in cell wall biosynthesis
MNIVQITPGAGAMYCGNCLRDNALVRELRAAGHNVLMVPVYLPLTLDEEDQSAGTPIFFGGINVFLGQKSIWFRNAPSWLHNLLSSPTLLRWASGKAASTRPEELGEITLSMLRGEQGRQARELDELIAWLKVQAPPDVIFLSNALLIGMARRLKEQLSTKIICMLQGEDSFLNALREPFRAQCWNEMVERAREVDHFAAPSRYFGDLMAGRLALKPNRVAVVYNGINLDGYSLDAKPVLSPGPPVIGFFARMCREKGLDLLVDACILINQRKKIPDFKLHIGGSCGPGDNAYVRSLQERLKAAGLAERTLFFPNLERAQKIAFFRGLTVFSVPARYGEAFGLYLIEALAAGVPAVQPRAAAFPEIIEATGGGLLCEPENPLSLCEKLEQLLSNPQRAAIGRRAQAIVHQEFNSAIMAKKMSVLAEKVAALAPSSAKVS